MNLSPRLVLSLVAALLFVFQVPVLRAAGLERTPDHEALRALRTKVVTALNGQDLETLSSCFAKEFAFTAVDQSTLTDKAQILAFWDKMFRGDGALLTSMKTDPTADILTRFVDENTGICYGSTKETYTMKGGLVVVMRLRWSATVIKEDGQWKVALAHVGTNFMDNPVLDRLESASKKAALMAGLMGLLVGALLVWFFVRKTKTAQV